MENDAGAFHGAGNQQPVANLDAIEHAGMISDL